MSEVRRWDLDRHAESAPRWVVAASDYDALAARLAEWKDLANKHFHTIGELEKRLEEAMAEQWGTADGDDLVREAVEYNGDRENADE